MFSLIGTFGKFLSVIVTLLLLICELLRKLSFFNSGYIVFTVCFMAFSSRVTVTSCSALR